MKRWTKHTSETPRVDLTFDHSEDLTSQEYEEESNINTIMARYLAGEPLPTNVKMGTYGDFYEAPDFQKAQDVLATATAQFAALPSHVRNRFQNRPDLFLEFVHNKDNLIEARKLGILTETAADTPAPPATTTTDTPPKGGN